MVPCIQLVARIRQVRGEIFNCQTCIISDFARVPKERKCSSRGEMRMGPGSLCNLWIAGARTIRERRHLSSTNAGRAAGRHTRGLIYRSPYSFLSLCADYIVAKSRRMQTERSLEPIVIDKLTETLLTAKYVDKVASVQGLTHQT